MPSWMEFNFTMGKVIPLMSSRGILFLQQIPSLFYQFFVETDGGKKVDATRIDFSSLFG